MNGFLDGLLSLFVRRDRTPTAADSTADNIVAASATGAVALNVQAKASSTVDAMKVHVNGGYALRVDSLGTCIYNGYHVWRYTAITPSASPGTGGAIIPASNRTVLAVASAASASRHIMLPAASTYPTGLILFVIDAAGTGATETITVNVAGSDTINAAATTKTITAAYGGLMFMTIASNKWICWAYTAA